MQIVYLGASPRNTSKERGSERDKSHNTKPATIMNNWCLILKRNSVPQILHQRGAGAI